MGILPFSGGNANRRAFGKKRVSVEVIDVDRRLDEEEVVGLQFLDHTERRRRIRPAIGHVDHQHKIISDGFSARGDHLHNGVVRLLKAVVGVRPLDANLKFSRTKAVLPSFDRGGNLYAGRVAALADGAREKGLKF